jgi:putative transposase
MGLRSIPRETTHLRRRFGYRRLHVLLRREGYLIWSLDFVSDQLIDGRRFRILTVVDDCTRECLALVADTSLSGIQLARELDRLMIKPGKPRMVVTDNGSELTSKAILARPTRAVSRGTTSRR